MGPKSWYGKGGQVRVGEGETYFPILGLLPTMRVTRKNLLVSVVADG